MQCAGLMEHSGKPAFRHALRLTEARERSNHAAGVTDFGLPARGDFAFD